MNEKASIYTMNALKKLSELWYTSVNHKARPVVEGEHDKSWNDHDSHLWNNNQLAQLSKFTKWQLFSLDPEPFWIKIAVTL